MTTNQVDYKKEYTDENITSLSIFEITSSTEAIETKNVNLNDLYHIDQITSSLKPLIENYILNYYFKYSLLFFYYCWWRNILVFLYGSKRSCSRSCSSSNICSSDLPQFIYWSVK